MRVGVSVFVLCLMIFTVQAQKLKLKGTVRFNHQDLKGAWVNLYNGNELIQSKKTGKKGKFNFKLPYDHQFTVEISKKEFVTKRLAVNTNTGRKDKSAQRFEFEIDLQKEDVSLMLVDDFELDFPFALIRYRGERSGFVYDVGYTKQMKELEDDLSRKQLNQVIQLFHTTLR